MNNFDRLKRYLLDLKTTTSLVRNVKLKMSVTKAAWHGREMPYDQKLKLEDLQRLKSEFLAHAFKMGWEIE